MERKNSKPLYVHRRIEDKIDRYSYFEYRRNYRRHTFAYDL